MVQQLYPFSQERNAANANERKWRKSNLEVFRIAWKNSMSSYRQALKTARTEYIRKLIDNHQTIQGFYLAQWLD